MQISNKASRIIDGIVLTFCSLFVLLTFYLNAIVPYRLLETLPNIIACRKLLLVQFQG